MNILHPTTAAVKAPATQVTFAVAPTRPLANDLYWQGFMAYCNTDCVVTDLATAEERRGWMAALRAQAHAESVGA